jgi:predicted RNase H-like HicB family nuclease
MTKKQKTYSFTVVLEPAENGWFISVPEFEQQGAATQGDTQEEAVENIKEVMEMIIESYAENGREIPLPFTITNDANKKEVRVIELVAV